MQNYAFEYLEFGNLCYNMLNFKQYNTEAY